MGARGVRLALCGFALLCALGLGQRPAGRSSCGAGRLLRGTGTNARCCRSCARAEGVCPETDCECIQPEFHCGDPQCKSCKRYSCPPGQEAQPEEKAPDASASTASALGPLRADPRPPIRTLPSAGVTACPGERHTGDLVYELVSRGGGVWGHSAVAQTPGASPHPPRSPQACVCLSPGNFNFGFKCVDCVAGTFSGGHEGHCKPWADCSQFGFLTTFPGNKTHNAVCSPGPPPAEPHSLLTVLLLAVATGILVLTVTQLSLHVWQLRRQRAWPPETQLLLEAPPPPPEDACSIQFPEEERGERLSENKARLGDLWV